MESSNRKPNVLFVMADQYRHDYIGAAGADFVRTPNLDALAARGTLFTQCTTNCPVCVPARIGLATGLQTLRAGILENGFGAPADGLPMMYQRIRDHGYRVGSVGKLHLGGSGPLGRKGDRPCAFGFGFTDPCECEGKIGAGLMSSPQGPYTHYLQDLGLLDTFHKDYVRRAAQAWTHVAWSEPLGDSVLPAEAFEDTYLGRRAVDWLESVPDDYPWFYFVSFVGPHDPFDPPTEYAERYREAQMPEPIPSTMDGKPSWIQGRDVGFTPEEVAVTRRQYCASIEVIDDAIGDIFGVLEARGMAEDTYVVFTSDHGEMLGDHGLYAKWVPYEASLRVPLIVSGPGLPRGRTSDALIELIDTNPTVCELLGIPAQPRIDARSFVPVLRGDSNAHRSEAVAAIENYRCIRTEQYKFVDNYNDVPELYDLELDPLELGNVADRYSEVVSELDSRMRRRFRQSW